MDARGTDIDDVGATVPAVAESTQRLHMKIDEEEQTGEFTGCLKAPALTSRVEVSTSQGDKHSIQTTPGIGLEYRSTKRQAGKRSRFRPWGYI